jgi:CBS domain containing-hemolysin-like protein
MTTFLIPLFVIFILILLNGLYVAAEFALVTAPRPQLRKKAAEGSASAKSLLHIISSPELQNRYITTAQVGITVASLGLGMYGEHAFAEWFIEPLHFIGSMTEPLAHTIASILSVGLLTYLHVVLGEMIPKSYALQSGISTILALYRPLIISDRIFSPIVRFLNKISFGIVELIEGSNEEKATRLFTTEDLEYIVGESKDSGLLEESDRIFIENIIDLDERIASQIMTPRNRVKAIEVNTPFDEIVKFICATNKTRYPIYVNSLDNIIGILHIKDLARWQITHPEDNLIVSEIIRPVILIPETLLLSELLIKFRKEQTQIAVSLDEYGGTAGIVSFEDLVEEVVGEILDEFDHETPPFQELAPGLIRVRGDVILDELEQHYGLEFDDSIQSYSIGGYVMSLLGTIPKPNDSLQLPNCSILVEKVENRAVTSVRIKFSVKNP